MRSPLPKPLLFGASIFTASGLLILCLSLSDVIETLGFLNDAVKTTGTVERLTTQYTEVGTKPNRSRSITNLAVIRYSNVDETPIVFEHTYGLLEGILEPGQQVTVAYLPQHPEQARVVLFSALWAGHIAMLIMASLFIGASVVLIKVFRD